MPKKRKQPRCHSCHRRSLRWLEGRQRFLLRKKPQQGPAMVTV